MTESPEHPSLSPPDLFPAKLEEWVSSLACSFLGASVGQFIRSGRQGEQRHRNQSNERGGWHIRLATPYTALSGQLIQSDEPDLRSGVTGIVRSITDQRVRPCVAAIAGDYWGVKLLPHDVLAPTVTSTETVNPTVGEPIEKGIAAFPPASVVPPKNDTVVL